MISKWRFLYSRYLIYNRVSCPSLKRSLSIPLPLPLSLLAHGVSEGISVWGWRHRRAQRVASAGNFGVTITHWHLSVLEQYLGTRENNPGTNEIWAMWCLQQLGGWKSLMSVPPSFIWDIIQDTFFVPRAVSHNLWALCWALRFTLHFTVIVTLRSVIWVELYRPIEMVF